MRPAQVLSHRQQPNHEIHSNTSELSHSLPRQLHTRQENNSQGSVKQGSPKMHLHPTVTFRSPSTSAAPEQLQSQMQLKNQSLVTSYLLLEMDCKVLESKYFMFAQCLEQQKPCQRIGIRSATAIGGSLYKARVWFRVIKIKIWM